MIRENRLFLRMFATGFLIVGTLGSFGFLPDQCDFPMDSGIEGDKDSTRYFFQKNTTTCKPFRYRGLGGNTNNFLSKRSCTADCVCQTPPPPGTGNTSMTMYYFDHGEVKAFMFHGGKRQGNIFKSAEECTKDCVCPLSVDPGHCAAALIRYYFNSETGKCERFLYSGCPGNANNFESLDDCMDACVEMKKNKPV